MEVILLQRIEKLGQMGQVVKVKAGYARNYLLPRRKAIRATDDNKAKYEKQRAQLEATNLAKRQEAEAISGKVEGITVVIIRQAGETGQLYGSVSARDVAAAATKVGVTIDRNQILMDRPLKDLGLHPVRVALHPEVIVTITANVAKSEEEAELQVKAGHAIVGTAVEEAPSLDQLLEQAEQATDGEAAAPAEGEKPAKKAKADKSDKGDKAEKPEKKARGEKAEKSGGEKRSKAEKSGKAEGEDKPAKKAKKKEKE
jgi:large subunit ribosomal protein L9